MEATIEDPESLVRTLYSHFEKRNYIQLVESLSPQVDWYYLGPSSIPFCGRYHGREEVTGFFNTVASRCVFTEFKPDEFYTTEQGAIVVTGRETVKSTLTDKTWKGHWVHIWRIHDNLIASVRMLHETAPIVEAHTLFKVPENIPEAVVWLINAIGRSKHARIVLVGLIVIIVAGIGGWSGYRYAYAKNNLPSPTTVDDQAFKIRSRSDLVDLRNYVKIGSRYPRNRAYSPTLRRTTLTVERIKDSENRFAYYLYTSSDFEPACMSTNDLEMTFRRIRPADKSPIREKRYEIIFTVPPSIAVGEEFDISWRTVYVNEYQGAENQNSIIQIKQPTEQLALELAFPDSINLATNDFDLLEGDITRDPSELIRTEHEFYEVPGQSNHFRFELKNPPINRVFKIDWVK